MIIGNVDLDRYSFIEMTNDVLKLLVDDSDVGVRLGISIMSRLPKSYEVFKLKNDGGVLKLLQLNEGTFNVDVNASEGTGSGRIGEASYSDLNASTSRIAIGLGIDKVDLSSEDVEWMLETKSEQDEGRAIDRFLRGIPYALDENMKEGIELYRAKNEKTRFKALCKGNSYEQMIHAALCLDKKTFKIKKRYGVNVHPKKLYRAKKRVQKETKRNIGKSYSYMHLHAHMARDTNLGIIAIMQRGLRPFIGVDGYHLKGPYGKTFLSTIAVAGNYRLFPMAFAVIELKNEVRVKMMKRFNNRYEKACAWEGQVTPKIKKKLDSVKYSGRFPKVVPTSDSEFNVFQGSKTYAVSLRVTRVDPMDLLMLRCIPSKPKKNKRRKLGERPSESINAGKKSIARSVLRVVSGFTSITTRGPFANMKGRPITTTLGHGGGGGGAIAGGHSGAAQTAKSTS
ncbi:Uncharacterized protein TCM_036012 [Theobroma cacao]|uniref:Uncharacterized protein n=1 Tax=Theobroma cacao TaxID=3641 RepID=A0A061FIM0_THECC|nr:Uncharacterized protein TCM_036012 [Theobroma cacao]